MTQKNKIMVLREITKKVVSYCEIPEGLIDEGHWINHHGQDAYVEVHIDTEESRDELDKWLIENYPELEQEESFFIHLDY